METGHSIPIWVRGVVTEAPKDDGSQLTEDLSTDVCVIGAGIAGLSVALSLLEAGQRVLVIDRASIGGGETSRSSAHLASAVDDRYYLIEEHRGSDTSRWVAESHREAIARVEKWVNQYGIDCGFKRVDGYLFLAAEQPENELELEAVAATRAGLQVERVAQVDGLAQLGPALRFAEQARIDPIAYVQGLAAAVRRAGGRIFEHCEAEEIRDGTPCHVALHGGHEVQCRAVAVCTNVPFHRRVTYHTKQAAYRTFMIAARAPRGSFADALYWDTGNPYHYMRWLGDASGDTDYLLIGGADHKTGQRDADEQPYADLLRWARSISPQLNQVEYAWSGQVIEPTDGLAFIGRDPGSTNIFVVTGDSGNGLTHGTLAAPLLEALIAGRSHPWEATYDPSRKPVNLQWARENANVAWQYRDWVAPADHVQLDAVGVGQGVLLRRGVHLVAVARDEAGKLHAFNARCPHLGCAVRWNKQERSWDCPCHGSRFDRDDGHVLNGPASAALTAADLNDLDTEPREPRAA